MFKLHAWAHFQFNRKLNGIINFSKNKSKTKTKTKIKLSIKIVQKKNCTKKIVQKNFTNENESEAIIKATKKQKQY